MQSVKPQLSIPPLAYLVVHSLHLVTVHLQYQLTDFQAASLERSPVLVDVNYTGQRMLRVGTSFDCDAQNGFRFLHRDMQIAPVVRYDIGAVVYASNCSAAASMLLTLMTAVGVVVHRHVLAVLAQGQSLHRLVASHVAVATQ